MKKIFIILLFITNFTFAAGFRDVQKWYPITMLPEVKNKLQEGDIIIFKPLNSSLTGRFGHIALIGEDKKIIDFPNPSVGFREIPVDILALGEYRDILVLRYRNSTKKFRKQLMKEAYSYLKKSYSILSFQNIEQNSTYCSLFIHDIYEKINDKDKTVFPASTLFVFPEEFINAGENFYILDLDKLL
ncbi:YiiX/YebB-like N1pC/P60 family cysteine hydrolase [Oceanivirga salmonicida]|uniref:YiiX/YebB-like N1pC/P60 family cysteine hydrolase n=1 Tax=Oceanivirga salmonicida TaxID=1769291 RepID=UPI0012E27F39|nr:YiiX/YebB-like N1pC/P60 family cysteine hydrolase [Oceanivirga salmonicida]